MANEQKPFMVLVEEVRQKPMVVWAEDEVDASWKALAACQREAVNPAYCHKVMKIRKEDADDQAAFPHYCKEGSQ